MLRAKGGENVGKGTYWDFQTGKRVHIDSEGILPGDEKTTYYRVHPAVLLAIGPVLGLIYAVFLPFIGIGMLVAAVSGKLLGGVAEGLWKGASFSWRPTEAYLAGKKKRANPKKDA